MVEGAFQMSGDFCFRDDLGSDTDVSSASFFATAFLYLRIFEPNFNLSR